MPLCDGCTRAKFIELSPRFRPETTYAVSIVPVFSTVRSQRICLTPPVAGALFLENLKRRRIDLPLGRAQIIPPHCSAHMVSFIQGVTCTILLFSFRLLLLDPVFASIRLSPTFQKSSATQKIILSSGTLSATQAGSFILHGFAKYMAMPFGLVVVCSLRTVQTVSYRYHTYSTL